MGETEHSSGVGTGDSGDIQESRLVAALPYSLVQHRGDRVGAPRQQTARGRPIGLVRNHLLWPVSVARPASQTDDRWADNLRLAPTRGGRCRDRGGGALLALG